MFSQIRDLWVNPEIDLFATRVNTQLAIFASWKPDPEATHTDRDAFTILIGVDTSFVVFHLSLLFLNA